MTTVPNRQRLSALLKATPLFARLDAKTRQKLVTHAYWKEANADEIIVLEGEQMPGLFVLQHGWVKVVKTAVSGREHVLRFFEPGDLFNEMGLFTNHPSPATIMALEPVGLWLIPRSVVADLLQREPAFAQHVIEQLAEHMIYLVSLITDISLHSVTERLAGLLLDSATEGVVKRPRWYTQAQLAARLGTVPDVVQRALRDLDSAGIIAVQRHQIRILDRAGLEEIAP